MLGVRNKRAKKESLLQLYGAQMGRIAERNRAELALLIAKQDAEKSAELARKAMLDAQAANRAKTEFLANMSHELRTPLNAIIGFSDMMKSKMLGPTGGDKFLEYAKDIHDSGQHLLELINDILDLAKIESGKLELHEQIINVNRITKSCLILIKERANEGRLSVHDRLPSDAPALRADERKFKQIMINLLSNAVKFTPAGGEIVVDGLIDRDRSFAITVSDTGIGIAREDIWKAMAPFMQVESDLGRKFEGTGLGLSLTKAFVELHGGTMTIESEVGVGTAVTVRFPAERVIADAGRSEIWRLSGAGAGHR